MSAESSNGQQPVELKERAWRLVDIGYASGPRNMAIDEAILLAHSRGEVPPTLRFYGWQPAAVSIGYFQRMAAEVDLEACRRLGYGWVRRPTGGRAIFHHIELTYSVVVREELLPGGVLETYRYLAAGLLEGLRRLGAPAEMAGGEKDPRSMGGDASPACFDAPSAYELVVGGRKVIGSAQTRREGTILQHGTILLDLDIDLLFTLLKVPEGSLEAAKEHLRHRATSLKEVLGREVPWAEARDAFAAGFASGMGLSLSSGGLTTAEQALADRLEAEKYGHDSWNLRR